MAAGEEEGAGAGVASAAALRRYKAAGGLNLGAARVNNLAAGGQVVRAVNATCIEH